MQYKVEKTKDGKYALLAVGIEAYNKELPTLESDKPYWEAKLGTVIGEGEIKVHPNCKMKQPDGTWSEPIHNIVRPIPPKEVEGDLCSWDMAWHKYKRETPHEKRNFKSLLDYFEASYNLTKK
jgi:hypothetical protein